MESGSHDLTTAAATPGPACSAATDAIPEIALLVEDAVRDVQERTAFALGTIGDPSAEPYLKKARDKMRAQKKATMADMMQEGLDEISGKSPTTHTKCP
ncbi:MAG: hypothetical protein ABI983_09595 [Acidobacteriota bacterium]